MASRESDQVIFEPALTRGDPATTIRDDLIIVSWPPMT
jgi:hypothetical protein